MNGDSWYYLCFVRWGPTFRPVFLAMKEEYTGDASQPRERDAIQLEADAQTQVPHKRLLTPRAAPSTCGFGGGQLALVDTARYHPIIAC